MYVSVEQLRVSLDRLSTLHPFFGTAYLALKRTSLPVGESEEVVFSKVVDELLYEYYWIGKEFPGFYHPFKSSNRWVRPRYGRRQTTAYHGGPIRKPSYTRKESLGGGGKLIMCKDWRVSRW